MFASLGVGEYYFGALYYRALIDMGAGASKGLNRIDMLKATESPRFLMNQILQFILEEISDKDVFKLQDPAVCQSFLILTASSLKKYFDTIDIYPSKDGQNRLYFRRISELTKPQSKQLAEQTQDNCTALGYFYIRILQIYIALALSLIDDPKLVPGRIEYRGQNLSRSRRPLAPGARIRGGGNGSAGAEDEDELYPKMKYIGQGGAGSDPVTFSDLIEERILQEPIGGAGRQGRKYAFVEKPQIIVKPSTETTGVVMEEGIIDNAQIRRPGGRYSYNDDYSYNRSGSRSQRPAIGIRFVIEDQQSIMQIPEISVAGGRQSISPPISITLNEEYNPTDYQVGRTLAEFFDNVLQELNNNRKSRILESLRQQQPQQQQQVRRREAIPLTASRAMPALDFSQNIQALAAKPLAHCIARSFQLLNIDALGSQVPKSAVTHICETKFKDDIVVPGAGESIARIPGVHALNFLFFVLDKTPRLTDKTREEYALSLSALSKAFSEKPRVYEIGDSELKDGSKAIETVRATAAPCKKRGDQIISEPTVKLARAGAASLWSFQREHAERVEKIFRKLFSIDKTGQIAFNDFVFQKGIAGINAIAAEARVVLVEYYSKCEEIYRDTVSKMGATL